MEQRAVQHRHFQLYGAGGRRNMTDSAGVAMVWCAVSARSTSVFVAWRVHLQLKCAMVALLCGAASWFCELIGRDGPIFIPVPWNNGELALNAFERAFARKLTPPRKFLSCAIVEVKGGCGGVCQGVPSWVGFSFGGNASRAACSFDTPLDSLRSR